jgi:hypothetical protein
VVVEREGLPLLGEGCGWRLLGLAGVAVWVVLLVVH